MPGTYIAPRTGHTLNDLRVSERRVNVAQTSVVAMSGDGKRVNLDRRAPVATTCAKCGTVAAEFVCHICKAPR